MRGLKFAYLFIATICFDVAPFAGAWIEIKKKISKKIVEIVAPFAGAWIEMNTELLKFTHSTVAPFAGAWIEIFVASRLANLGVSHPSRVRGLK